LNSENSLLLEKLHWNGLSEVDDLLHVALRKVEKQVPNGDLVRTTKCITLYPRSCINRDRYNRVQQ